MTFSLYVVAGVGTLTGGAGQQAACFSSENYVCLLLVTAKCYPTQG